MRFILSISMFEGETVPAWINIAFHFLMLIFVIVFKFDLKIPRKATDNPVLFHLDIQNCIGKNFDSCQSHS